MVVQYKEKMNSLHFGPWFDVLKHSGRSLLKKFRKDAPVENVHESAASTASVTEASMNCMEEASSMELETQSQIEEAFQKFQECDQLSDEAQTGRTTMWRKVAEELRSNLTESKDSELEAKLRSSENQQTFEEKVIESAPEIETLDLCVTDDGEDQCEALALSESSESVVELHLNSSLAIYGHGSPFWNSKWNPFHKKTRVEKVVDFVRRRRRRRPDGKGWPKAFKKIGAMIPSGKDVAQWVQRTGEIALFVGVIVALIWALPAIVGALVVTLSFLVWTFLLICTTLLFAAYALMAAGFVAGLIWALSKRSDSRKKRMTGVLYKPTN